MNATATINTQSPFQMFFDMFGTKRLEESTEIGHAYVSGMNGTLQRDEYKEALETLGTKNDEVKKFFKNVKTKKDQTYLQALNEAATNGLIKDLTIPQEVKDAINTLNILADESNLPKVQLNIPDVPNPPINQSFLRDKAIAISRIQDPGLKATELQKLQGWVGEFKAAIVSKGGGAFGTQFADSLEMAVKNGDLKGFTRVLDLVHDTKGFIRFSWTKDPLTNLFGKNEIINIASEYKTASKAGPFDWLFGPEDYTYAARFTNDKARLAEAWATAAGSGDKIFLHAVPQTLGSAWDAFWGKLGSIASSPGRYLEKIFAPSDGSPWWKSLFSKLGPLGFIGATLGLSQFGATQGIVDGFTAEGMGKAIQDKNPIAIAFKTVQTAITMATTKAAEMVAGTGLTEFFSGVVSKLGLSGAITSLGIPQLLTRLGLGALIPLGVGLPGFLAGTLIYMGANWGVSRVFDYFTKPSVNSSAPGFQGNPPQGLTGAGAPIDLNSLPSETSSKIKDVVNNVKALGIDTSGLPS